MTNERKSIHGEWSSSFAFILAATGAAVGLGNIWKFPYIAGQNGGGAFVLVYLVCIAILGIPILMTEIMIGRLGRQNPANSFSTLAVEAKKNKHWRIVGFLTVLAGFLILSYYTVIAGWSVDYIYQAAAGHFAKASTSHIDALFADLISHPLRLLFWHTVVVISTVGVVVFGVQKGLERAVKYLFPAMCFLLLVIVMYSIQTGFFAQGINFLFKPNLSALTPNSILIALGHAFFTLSIATGSIMMYGAYLPHDASIPKATLAIIIADTLIALLAGLAIFPIVFAHGLEPSAGPGLIFKTLPIAFGNMPYGNFFATLFFIMLFFAAYTSAISLIEPTVAWLIENLGMTRTKSTISAGVVLWVLGIGTVLSFNEWENYKIFGLNFFEALDYLTANIMLPLGGFFIALFGAWRLKKRTTLEALNFRNGLYYKSWRLVLGIVAPIAISIVFLNAIGVITL